MNRLVFAFLIIFGTIISLFLYFYFAVSNGWWPVLLSDLQEKGQFGDSFGVFTSLFSALAFGGVLFTLWFQHEVMESNKREDNVRNFEAILFNLLSSYNSIVQDMDLHDTVSGELVAKGRDCFYRYVLRTLRPAYKKLKRDSPDGDELVLVKNLYGNFWVRHRHNLGHYLRFLYNIFKFIDGSSIPENLKKRYTNIVRSQLSDYELLILFYNCLHDNGVERFKPLAEKYSLFNNLPEELIFNPTHKHFYSKSAF